MFCRTVLAASEDPASRSSFATPTLVLLGLLGTATRLKFTFDAGATDKGVQFTAEHLVNGKFVVDEQEIHVPMD